MDTAEVVIREIDCNHVAVILKLFRECIREPGELFNAHSDIPILPFRIARRDLACVRIAIEHNRARADAFSGAVTRFPLSHSHGDGRSSLSGEILQQEKQGPQRRKPRMIPCA